MCLKPYDYSYTVGLLKSIAEEFMETIFDYKEQIGDGMYMKMCAKLQHVHSGMNMLQEQIRLVDGFSYNDYELKQRLNYDYYNLRIHHETIHLQYTVGDIDAKWTKIGDVYYIKTTDDRIYNKDYEYLGMYIDETGEIICY